MLLKIETNPHAKILNKLDTKIDFCCRSNQISR